MSIIANECIQPNKTTTCPVYFNAELHSLAIMPRYDILNSGLKMAL